MITAQASPFGKSVAIPPAAMVARFAWSRLANGAGRIFWGWFSDFVGREMAMFIPFVLQAALSGRGVEVRPGTNLWELAAILAAWSLFIYLGQHVLALSRHHWRLLTARNAQLRTTASSIPPRESLPSAVVALPQCFSKVWQAGTLPVLLDRRPHAGFRITDSRAALLPLPV